MVVSKDQCCIYGSVDLQNQEAKIRSQCATAKITRPKLTCLKLTQELSDTNSTPSPCFLPDTAQATTDQADWGEREGRGLLQVEDILAPFTECGPQVGANHLQAVLFLHQSTSTGQLACFLPMQYIIMTGNSYTN